MSLYYAYIIIGLSIAMPIGAISIGMINQGLRNGFIHGWAIGLGGMTIDLLMIIALYFGLAKFLSLPYIQLLLWIIGAIFLFLLAYDSIKNADKGIGLEASSEKNQKTIFFSYCKGILLAVSPGNLVFWLSVFGTVLTDSYKTSGEGEFFIIALGILTGVLIHDILLLTIVSLTRKVVNKTIIKWTSIIAGIILFGFACYFVYEFYISIKGLI